MKMNNLVGFVTIIGRKTIKEIQEILKQFEKENKGYKFEFKNNDMFVISHNQVKYKLIPILSDSSGREVIELYTDKDTAEILKF